MAIVPEKRKWRLRLPSGWEPLRQPLFRALWLAALASNLGTWMHEVGADWLMTSLSTSPLLVSLVETATSLPVFLLSLVAGALADVVDRRRLLLFTQCWMLMAAAGLGILTLAGGTTPWGLLGFTFLLNIGSALNAPAWQALVPELVAQDEIPSAVALNSVGFNIARSVGPALGGLVVAYFGSGMVFLLNAASFFSIIVLLARWRRTSHKSALPAERVLGAMRAGIRYVRYAVTVRHVFARTGLFIFFASSIWGLAPILARQSFGLGASGYGVFLGCLGAGAVAAASVLQRVRQAVSTDRLLAAGTLVFSVSLVVIALTPHFALACLAMAAGGAAWTTTLSTLTAITQISVPSWVRGRALAAYQIVFFGGMALGSTIWGAVAAHVSTSVSLLLAAVGLATTLAAIKGYPLTLSTRDLSPTMHWPEPVLAWHPGLNDGPVLVTVEYSVEPSDTEGFLDAMRELERRRRRGGAIQWALFHDVARPSRYVETSIVESWAEELRRHEHVTVEDRIAEERVLSFLANRTPPSVTHLVAAHVHIHESGHYHREKNGRTSRPSHLRATHNL
jgi:MFS family permease